MDSSVSPKDEIWFLRVCHHISKAVASGMLHCCYILFPWRWNCKAETCGVRGWKTDNTQFCVQWRYILQFVLLGILWINSKLHLRVLISSAEPDRTGTATDVVRSSRNDPDLYSRRTCPVRIPARAPKAVTKILSGFIQLHPTEFRNIVVHFDLIVIAPLYAG